MNDKYIKGVEDTCDFLVKTLEHLKSALAVHKGTIERGDQVQQNMFYSSFKSALDLTQIGMDTLEELFNQLEKPIRECPHCHSNTLIEGPSAGLSQNMLCKDCGREWNFSPFGAEPITPPRPELYGAVERE